MSTRPPQPPKPRLRADLEWSHHVDQSRWIARDPLTAAFYTFSQIERRAVELMTGGLSPTDIADRMRQAFPTAAIDQAWLNSLLSRLQLHHLLVPSSRAETARIAAERSGLRRRGWLQQSLVRWQLEFHCSTPHRS